MKTPRDRAIDIAHEFSGKAFSRRMFVALLEDDGETGATFKRLVEIVARGVADDRAAVRAEGAPS